MAGQRASVNPVDPGTGGAYATGVISPAPQANEPFFGTTMRQSIDWTAVRQRVILDPTVVMLNTGSFGPLPQPVFDRATQLRLRLAAGPTDFFVRQVPPLLWETRERTAAFLGTTPQRLIFTTNVSAAINLIAS